MNNIDVNQLLSQMRAMSTQAVGKEPEAATGTQGSFAELLKASVEKVNDTQQKAGELATAFQTGEKQADLGEVMVALQKANVSFQAMVQVRNKLVEAYKDVMNMPL